MSLIEFRERLDKLEKINKINIPANQELFRSALVGRQELDKRLDKLENPKPLKGMRDIVEKPKDSEVDFDAARKQLHPAPLNYQMFDRYEAVIKTQDKEIERLKKIIEQTLKENKNPMYYLSLLGQKRMKKILEGSK